MLRCGQNSGREASWLCAAALLLSAAQAADVAPPADAVPVDAEADGAVRLAEIKLIERSVDSGLAFLRTAQNADGSFGSQQQRLQTGLAILAFLSAGATPDADAASPLPRAAEWLLKHTGEDGFLGDGDSAMESHAVAALALSELIGVIPDAAQDKAVTRRADEAFRYTLAAQDKAVGAEFYGGWKIAPKDKGNDRRVTAWCLFFLKSMELRGREVPKAAYARALSFIEGSQKMPSADKKQDKAEIGGFSYDAAGIAVYSVTGAGLACMSLFGRARERRDLTVEWLRENQVIWYGPNFFDSNFFISRGMAREMGRGPAAESAGRAFFSRLRNMLRDHQNPDGSFQVPPANAENTITMGKTYATPFAILILNATRQLLPIDATE